MKNPCKHDGKRFSSVMWTPKGHRLSVICALCLKVMGQRKLSRPSAKVTKHTPGDAGEKDTK